MTWAKSKSPPSPFFKGGNGLDTLGDDALPPPLRRFSTAEWLVKGD